MTRRPKRRPLGATLASFLLAVSRFSFLAGRPSFRPQVTWTRHQVSGRAQVLSMFPLDQQTLSPVPTEGDGSQATHHKRRRTLQWKPPTLRTGPMPPQSTWSQTGSGTFLQIIERRLNVHGRWAPAFLGLDRDLGGPDFGEQRLASMWRSPSARVSRGPPHPVRRVPSLSRVTDEETQAQVGGAWSLASHASSRTSFRPSVAQCLPGPPPPPGSACRGWGRD